MKLGYYDCWIGNPKYKTAIHGMHWTERNKRRAIAAVKRLLKLRPDIKRSGIIRFRLRGVIGDIKTWHKLPLVWRGDTTPSTEKDS